MPRPIEKGVYWKRERQINEVETEMACSMFICNIHLTIINATRVNIIPATTATTEAATGTINADPTLVTIVPLTERHLIFL